VHHTHASAQATRQVRGVSLERPLVEEVPGGGVARQCVLGGRRLSHRAWAIRT
jgi:hypothetical protein